MTYHFSHVRGCGFFLSWLLDTFAMSEPSGEVMRIVEVYEEIQNEVKESQLSQR